MLATARPSCFCMAAGLFLHVGYSVVERHAIESISDVRVDSGVMLQKLAVMLRRAATADNNQVDRTSVK